MNKEPNPKTKNILIKAGVAVGLGLTALGVAQANNGGNGEPIQVSAAQGNRGIPERVAPAVAAPQPAEVAIPKALQSAPLEVITSTTSTTTAANTAPKPTQPEVRHGEYSAEKKKQIAYKWLRAIEDDSISDPQGTQRYNEKWTLTKPDGSKSEIYKPAVFSNSSKLVALDAPELDHSKIFLVGAAPKAGVAPDANGYVPHEAQVIDLGDYAKIEVTPLSPVESQARAGAVTFEKRGIAVVGRNKQFPELAYDVGNLMSANQAPAAPAPEDPNAPHPEIQHGTLPAEIPPPGPG